MFSIQAIRLVDVFLLGPLMVYFGAKATNLPKEARVVMIASGIATILYNGQRYMIQAGMIDDPFIFGDGDVREVKRYPRDGRPVWEQTRDTDRREI